MNIWLITDTHFNHERLTEWGGRTGDWQEEIWKGLRAIPQDDTLIHLGDICIGNDEDLHERLANEVGGDTPWRVRKILVRGNHDKKSLSWYSDHGWDFVCDGLELLFHGHYLHLTHRPARPHGNITWNIHGHTHGNMHRSEEYLDFYSDKYHIDISPELVGYAPIRLDSLLKRMRA